MHRLNTQPKFALPSPPASPVPTIPRRPPTIVRSMPNAADHPGTSPASPVTAGLASDFVRWAAEHGLDRAWTVDDVWFLASEDFAPALGLMLPPRRVFLGALQKVAGVAVAYDRRIYSRDGRLKGKTTVYSLPDVTEPVALAG